MLTESEMLSCALLFLLAALLTGLPLAYRSGCHPGQHGREVNDTQIRGTEIWTLRRCDRCGAILRERKEGTLVDPRQARPSPPDGFWS